MWGRRDREVRREHAGGRGLPTPRPRAPRHLAPRHAHALWHLDLRRPHALWHLALRALRPLALPLPAPRPRAPRRFLPRPLALRRLTLFSLLPVLALALAGCGIRSTEVPTDFGPAPSRVRCALSVPDTAAQTSRGLAVQVFLLCGSSLVAVDRTVRVPDGTADSERRVLVAQGLLDQLAEAPSTAEREAGYQTYVRGGMTVSGPRPKDPEDTLRLSTAPTELSAYALAQVVCTFSDSAAAEGDGSVILGGPDTAPLRRYDCTDRVRSSPGTEHPPSAEVNGA